MVISKGLSKATGKPIVIFSFLIVVFAINASAHNLTDTSKKLLLASLDKRPEPVYVVKEANIVFPDILKGNEEEALGYIENFSSKRRDYIIGMYNKGRSLLPKASAILKKYGLPQELQILLILESAFNPNAVSKAGAVGYWQIMDAVAKEYGLKYAEQKSVYAKKKLIKKDAKKAAVTLKALAKQKDDRKNFNKSTHAAARYLRDRRHNLNDNWLLIVASYNCGVGNVWDAMQKSGKDNPTFWDIKNYLPAETRAYVMNFITLNVLFNNYSKFASNTLTFAPVKIEMTDNFEKNMTEALDGSK